jgi:hypothetical protein
MKMMNSALCGVIVDLRLASGWNQLTKTMFDSKQRQSYIPTFSQPHNEKLRMVSVPFWLNEIIKHLLNE